MQLTQDTFPRIKPIYPIYRVTPTSFRIGAQINITAEFDDPDGQVWELVQLMDGTRSFPEIVRAMQTKFSDLSVEDVAVGIATLDEEGFVEDAQPSIYDAQSNDPETRYVGNVNYFSYYGRLGEKRGRIQDILRHARVVLLGLGGAGSNILPLLAASGIGTIVAVDYDRVELSNLNRQFLYTEQDIVKLKTDGASRIISQINSTINFSTITQKIEAAEDVQPIIRGADLVICAIDEPPFLAQRRVNYASVKENVPCLYGFTQLTHGRLFTVLPHQTGCFDCLHIHYDQGDPIFQKQLQGFFAANFVAPTISFVPQIAKLCAIIADEAVRLLTKYTAPQTIATQLEVDYELNTVQALTSWPRYEQQCPTCGSGREEDFPGNDAYPGRVTRLAQSSSGVH